ncbi:HalOD1 output domain-containing protein [Halorarius litoreus]|uniref:HalOD1 output domain-containing protein n=1 Tax=Halorarius litoreus TaxID=2962676 RepID=UPI0020CDF74D|nr:HalOD1 output domain-containing protein [Halorarius litoreus]
MYENPRSYRSPSTYHVRHDPDGPAKLSTTVVHALADAMGVDVTHMGFSLYDAVDPDALDLIFAPHPDGTTRPPGHVAFSIQGYQTTVYSTGDIVITGR